MHVPLKASDLLPLQGAGRPGADAPCGVHTPSRFQRKAGTLLSARDTPNLTGWQHPLLLFSIAQDSLPAYEMQNALPL